jgi:superfamily I DNA/RNA helicase
MTGKTLDLNKPVVKIITLKSAKGLEFPIVALAGFTDGSFPVIPKGTPEEAVEEIMTRERRTLFVGMTRAMRALLIILPEENPSELLQNFDPKLWNLGSAASRVETT